MFVYLCANWCIVALTKVRRKRLRKDQTGVLQSWVKITQHLHTGSSSTFRMGRRTKGFTATHTTVTTVLLCCELHR